MERPKHRYFQICITSSTFLFGALRALRLCPRACALPLPCLGDVIIHFYFATPDASPCPALLCGLACMARYASF